VEESLAIFELAVEMSPGVSTYHSNLAVSYMRLKVMGFVCLCAGFAARFGVVSPAKSKRGLVCNGCPMVLSVWQRGGYVGVGRVGRTCGR
jgi:hypothetical protein